MIDWDDAHCCQDSGVHRTFIDVHLSSCLTSRFQEIRRSQHPSVDKPRWLNEILPVKVLDTLAPLVGSPTLAHSCFKDFCRWHWKHPERSRSSWIWWTEKRYYVPTAIDILSCLFLMPVFRRAPNHIQLLDVHKNDLIPSESKRYYESVVEL